MNLFRKDKKLELIKIEKSMSAEEIAHKLAKMLESQGIKIVKRDKKNEPTMAKYYRNFKKKKVGIPSGILPQYRSLTYEELCTTESKLKEELHQLRTQYRASETYKKKTVVERLIDDYRKKLEESRDEAIKRIRRHLDNEYQRPEMGILSWLGITDYFLNRQFDKRYDEIVSESNDIMTLLEDEELLNQETEPAKYTHLWRNYVKQQKYMHLLNLKGIIEDIHNFHQKIKVLNKEKWETINREKVIKRLLNEKIPELKKTSKERQKIARLDAYDKRSRQKGKTIINQIRKEHSQVFSCPYCSKSINKNDAEVDHIIPVSGGGLSLKNNLVLVCRDCNQTKRDKSIMDFCSTKNIPMEELYKRLKSLGKKI